MQSGSNAKQIPKDPLVEKLMGLLANKVSMYNSRLYVDFLKKRLTHSIYSNILKKGHIVGINKRYERITVHIDLQILKTFKSKIAKQLAVYGLLKDSEKLEVEFIIFHDNTVSTHRRLLGPTNESI